MRKVLRVFSVVNANNNTDSVIKESERLRHNISIMADRLTLYANQLEREVERESGGTDE
jgi:hypothetical protein